MSSLSRKGACALAALLSATGSMTPRPAASKTLQGGVSYFEDDYDPVRKEAVSDVGDKGEETDQAANQNQLMKALVQGLQTGAKGLDAAGKSRLEEVDATKADAAEASGVVAEEGDPRLAERLRALNQNARTGQDRDLPVDPEEGKVRTGGAIGDLRRNLADGLAQGAARTGGPEAGLKDALGSRNLSAAPRPLRGGVERKVEAAGLAGAAARGPVRAGTQAHGTPRVTGSPRGGAARKTRAPDPYEAYVRDAAKIAGVRPDFIKFLRGRETGGSKNPNAAVSSKGAKGAMQLMGEICRAKSLGGKMDPCDPSQAFKRAGKLLRYYRTHPKFKRWHTDDPAVLAALYNMGENRFRRAGLHRKTLGFGDAKRLKGRMSSETWRYLYQDAKRRKGLYASHPQLRAMSRAERERWLRDVGAAKAPRPATRPSGAPRQSPAKALAGRAEAFEPARAGAAAPGADRFLEDVGEALGDAFHPRHWMGAAYGADEAAKPRFDDALWKSLPLADPGTAAEISARIPGGIRADRLRILGDQEALAIVSGMEGQSALRLFTDRGLRGDHYYVLTGRTAAALAARYDLNAIGVPSRQRYIVLGGANVRVLYDGGPFDAYLPKRKRTFTLAQEVTYKILGDGDMAVEGVVAHGGFGIKATIKRMTIIDPRTVHIETNLMSKNEPLLPIERVAPSKRSPGPVSQEEPGRRQPFGPAAALLATAAAAALGLGAAKGLGAGAAGAAA